MHDGEYQNAIDDFTKAIKLDKTLHNAWCNRGICKNEIGDLKGAINDIKKAIKLNPTHADYHYSLFIGCCIV